MYANEYIDKLLQDVESEIHWSGEPDYVSPPNKSLERPNKKQEKVKSSKFLAIQRQKLTSDMPRALKKEIARSRMTTKISSIASSRNQAKQNY